ncbi:hypothetical protein QN084_01795 [Paenarthrobacter sp. R1]|uniref:hypothetical protein n=1 Tax=Paenarthrobacter sp. R1 TaxID=3049085 RepID=UPI002553C263|nr:hypothetical protein [Paenarthrobacter sp. R1]WIV31384.1 hypothetical protein QN084_01795 [Paenarthrobacter sp. R1]
MPAFFPHATSADKPRHLRPHPSLFAWLRRRNAGRVDTLRCTSDRRQPEPFDWPAELTLEALGEAIAASCGLEIVIKPIPDGMRHHEISGLTTVIGRTAHVFYDPELPPLNIEQTILHEFALILHGDVRADSDCTHLRSMFDDPVEKRAETTGMRLMDALHRRRRASEERSEVLVFLSGSDENGGV